MTFADLLTALGYNPADLGETFTIYTAAPSRPDWGDYLTSDELDRYTVTDYDLTDSDYSPGWCVHRTHGECEFLIESV